MEPVGGTLIVQGLFTRPVVSILSGFAAAANFMAHAPQRFLPAKNFGEPALLRCFAFLCLAATGPGRISIGRKSRSDGRTIRSSSIRNSQCLHQEVGSEDMTDETVKKVGDLLNEAGKRRAPIAPVREFLAVGGIAAAYAAQEVNTQRGLSAGRRLVGRKIGLTSLAVQKQLGVDQPDYGMLFRRHGGRRRLGNSGRAADPAQGGGGNRLRARPRSRPASASPSPT